MSSENIIEVYMCHTTFISIITQSGILMCLCPNLFSVPFHVFTCQMMFIQMGDSVLMVAARRCQTAVVKELTKAGADLNLQNKVYMFFDVNINVHEGCPVLPTGEFPYIVP